MTRMPPEKTLAVAACEARSSGISVSLSKPAPGKIKRAESIQSLRDDEATEQVRKVSAEE